MKKLFLSLMLLSGVFAFADAQQAMGGCMLHAGQTVCPITSSLDGPPTTTSISVQAGVRCVFESAVDTKFMLVINGSTIAVMPLDSVGSKADEFLKDTEGWGPDIYIEKGKAYHTGMVLRLNRKDDHYVVSIGGYLGVDHALCQPE